MATSGLHEQDLEDDKEEPEPFCMEEVLEKDQAEESGILPHYLWGMDCVFHARVKLNVRDVLELEDYPNYTDFQCISNHPISSVCIVGDVRGITAKDQFILYDVDDGTGCIACKWSREESQQQQHSESRVVLGDLVRITGKVYTYKGHRNIGITTIHRETDPNVEILHWLQTIKLKESFYKKPFTLPASFYEHKASLRRANIEEKVVCALNEMSKMKTTFSNEELEHLISKNMIHFNKDEIQSVLTLLQTNCYLIQTASANEICFQFCPDEKFCTVLLSIFKKCIGLCDPSLTVEQLLQELRDTDIKQYVSRNRLQDSLLLLLENNKIYPVEEDKYRLID